MGKSVTVLAFGLLVSSAGTMIAALNALARTQDVRALVLASFSIIAGVSVWRLLALQGEDS